MKYNVLLLSIGVLAGCAVPVPPQPTVVTQEVDKPVPVNCLVSQPYPPVYESGYLNPATSDGETLLELARNWVKSQIYEASVQASMAGCAALPPQATK